MSVDLSRQTPDAVPAHRYARAAMTVATEDRFDTEQDRIWQCGNHEPLQMHPELFKLEDCDAFGRNQTIGFLAQHFWRDVAGFGDVPEH